MTAKYYLENNEVKQDSNSSIPYNFVVKKIDNQFIAEDSRVPRDENYYSDDMKNIFPSNVRNEMKNIYTDGTMAKLKLDIEQQTKLYFHK